MLSKRHRKDGGDFLTLEQLQDLFSGRGPGQNGGSVDTGAPADSKLDEFKPGGGVLAWPYGLHLVGGQLGHPQYTEGPPPLNKMAILLGDGGGVGWDGAQYVSWKGETLAVSPDASTNGYRFHPGTWATGAAYPTDLQGVDPFLTSPLNFSGTAYVALKLTEAQSGEEAYDGHRGIYRCLKTYDFDQQGSFATTATYSTNPAVIAADGIRRAKLTHRVHWPSLYELKTHCDELIDWNDGTTTQSIKRFEAHPVWTSRFSLAELLDVVGLISGSTWQDDGYLMRWKLATDQKPSHSFTRRNIVPASFSPRPDKLRQRITELKLNFRDVQDVYLKESSVTARREDLIIEYRNSITQEITLPNMNWSQAWRIAEMLMRLSTDNPQRAELTGYEDSFHLLKGDYATVTHPENGWLNQLCRVEAVTDMTLKAGPGHRRYRVRRVDGSIYSDDDARPRQQEV